MMVVLTSVISHCGFLICISLIMSDVEHLFMCLLAIYMSSSEIFLFSFFFPPFLIGFFWYWVVWAACIFWKLIICQLFHLLLFSPILRVVVVVVFTLFVVFFAVQRFLSLIRSHLFIFVFISITLGDRSKKILLWFMLNVLCFSLRLL